MTFQQMTFAYICLFINRVSCLLGKDIVVLRKMKAEGHYPSYVHYFPRNIFSQVF